MSKRVNIPISSIIKIILFCVCLGSGAVVIVMSRRISDIIINTAVVTAKSVLPSLFPFLVISSFMADSGVCSYLEIFPGKLLEKIAGIKKEVTGAVILGLVSSFPVGAVTVCDIYKRGSISKREAEAGLCQAHCTGPAFPICFIGIYLWNSVSFGVFVYLSQILSMLILSRLFLFKRTAGDGIKELKSERQAYTRSLTGAITKASFSSVTVLGAIVFWKTVSNLLSVFTPQVNAVICAVLELSSGVISAEAVGGSIGAALTGFTVGFGGLAAMLQAAGAASDCGLSIKKALFFKLGEGVLNALLTLTFYSIIK